MKYFFSLPNQKKKKYSGKQSLSFCIFQMGERELWGKQDNFTWSQMIIKTKIETDLLMSIYCTHSLLEKKNFSKTKLNCQHK